VCSRKPVNQFRFSHSTVHGQSFSSRNPSTGTVQICRCTSKSPSQFRQSTILTVYLIKSPRKIIIEWKSCLSRERRSCARRSQWCDWRWLWTIFCEPVFLSALLSFFTDDCSTIPRLHAMEGSTTTLASALHRQNIHPCQEVKKVSQWRQRLRSLPIFGTETQS
jgi:hypothetical protein